MKYSLTTKSSSLVVRYAAAILLALLSLLLCSSQPAKAWAPPRRGPPQQQPQGAPHGAPQGLTPPHATLVPQQSRAKRRLSSLPLVGRLPTVLVGPVSRPSQPNQLDQDAWLQQELKTAAQTTKTPTSCRRLPSSPLSVAQVFQIAIPAVAVGLCWPVLSMQDTSAVGRGVAGTVAQAALHPAIAVLNYSSKLLIFLYSGTATMVSSSLSSPLSRSNKDDKYSNDDDDDDATNNCLSDNTIRVVDTAMQVAFAVGCLVMGLVWALCARQPAWMIQHGPATAVYTAIRAAAFPAAAVLATWQTASLGLRRVVGPVLLTLLAVATNAVGNAWLVPRGALQGAAWATVLAQYVAMVAGVWQWQAIKKKQGRPTTTATTTLRREPCPTIARNLAKYFVPITTTQASRSGISVALDTIIVQADSAPLSAAHQIITSIYYGVICNTGDGLSLAAQTLAPRSKSKQEKQRLYATMAKVAAGTGCLLAAVMGWSLSAQGVFTADQAVQDLMRLALPQFLVIGGLQTWFATSEGLLLGQQDLRCVGLSYGAFSILVPLGLWWAARGASTPAGLVSRLWTAWLGYAVFRILVLGGRALWLQYGPRADQQQQQEQSETKTHYIEPNKGAGLPLWKTLRMLLWSEDRLRPFWHIRG